MYPTTYGRSKLALYDYLSGRALDRFVDALAGMGDGSDNHAQTLMEEALRRKCARLQSVFPERTLPDLPQERSSLSAAGERLCQVTACWIDSINSLADDNELDVLRPDGNGQVRPVDEIIAEAILDDAALIGRLVALREPPFGPEPQGRRQSDSERSRRVELHRL